MYGRILQALHFPSDAVGHGAAVITKLVLMNPSFLSLTCCGVVDKWSEPFFLNIK